MQISRAKGFTLIEALIVVAVLGIVVVTALPLFMPSLGMHDVNNDGSLCRYGMKYDRNGKQIIGQTGGGMPCDNHVGIVNQGGVR